MQQDDFVLSKDNFGTILKRRPLLVQVVLKRLVDLRYGSLTITLPDGEVVEIKGQEPGPNAHITMKSYDLMKRVLKSGGVGVGESFMDGEWTSPNVAEFLQLFCVNHHLMFASQRKFITGLVLKAIHWSNRNTKKQAKRNISAHYDLGNDFYKKWLDSTMTYSSAIFEKEGQSLSQAQHAKYANLAKQIHLGENDHVLEIGCGWGGFAEFAASEIGCKVTGLTISREQLEFAQKRIFEAGLNEKVDLVFQDYREEKGTYDRIASIEMFEAVGKQYWPTYFQTLHDRLNEGGHAGVQVITIQDRFYKQYRSSADFIQRYIFPGGMLPTPEIMTKFGDEYGLRLTGERIFGHDYADTLAIWLKNFNAAWPDIKNMGFDERFKRMWQFYLQYCEAGFRAGNIDVRQMVFSK